MRQLYMVIVIIGFAVASPTFAAAKFLTIVNNDDDSIVQVAVATPDTTAYRPLDVGAPLQVGKAGQATVSISGPCVVDLRISYATYPSVTITHWDVCRQPTLYAGKARHAAIRHARDNPI